MKLGVLILLSAFLSGGCVCPAQAAGSVRVCSCENNSEGGGCHKSELAEGKHDLHGDEVSKGARGKATQLCPFWPRRIIPFG